jgi:hypothetical protein
MTCSMVPVSPGGTGTAAGLSTMWDVVTCGVLSQGLAMETRGLAFDFLLLVWPREGTFLARVAASFTQILPTKT